MLKLIGNIGENAGIVSTRNKFGITLWLVEFDNYEPTNLNKAIIKQQLSNNSRK